VRRTSASPETLAMKLRWPGARAKDGRTLVLWLIGLVVLTGVAVRDVLRTGAAAAIGVGAIWARWHLSPVLGPGGAPEPTDMAQTYVRLISTAVVSTWLNHSTRGGLLLVMVAHAAHNLAIDLLPPSTTAASMTLTARAIDG